MIQGVLPPMCGPGSPKPSDEHVSSIDALMSPRQRTSELPTPLSVGVLSPYAVDSPFSAPSVIPKSSSEDAVLVFQDD